jgi:RHS repeat-associated protein
MQLRIMQTAQPFGVKSPVYLELPLSATNSTVPSSPGRLEYKSGAQNVEVISANSAIQQVKGNQGLTDIQIANDYKYTINLYTSNQIGGKVDGLYSSIPGAQPFVIYTVENPDTTSATNHIWITETRDSVSGTNKLTYRTNGWDLLLSDNTTTRSFTSTNISAGVRQEIRELFSGATRINSEVQTFMTFPWGEEIVQAVAGIGTVRATNSYVYYTNSANPSSYQKLQQIVDPSGRWEYYLYDSLGRMSKKYAPFLNQTVTTNDSLCRVTEYSYTPFGGDTGSIQPISPRQTVEKVKGQEVNRSYVVYLSDKTIEIQAQTPGAVWNASDNLYTTNTFYPSGAFQDSLKNVISRDKVLTVFEYGISTDNSQVTNIVYVGQPDAAFDAVVDGTKTVSVFGLAGETISTTTLDIATGVILARDIYSYTDDLHRSYSVSHLDGTVEAKDFACCGLVSSTEADGTVTQYFYDALNRETAKQRNNILITNILDSAGNILVTKRIAGGSTIIQRQATYDALNRPLYETNALGGWISYSQGFDGAGQAVKTNIFEDGGTRIETYAIDGSLVRVTGTAVHPIRFQEDVESESGTQRLFRKEMKLDSSGTDLGEWTKTYRDLVGRDYKTVYAAAVGTPFRQSYYNSNGQLVKQIDEDGVATLFQYNNRGELEYTCLDLNANGAIDFAGSDRISRNLADVISTGLYALNVKRTRTFVWETDGSSNSNLVKTVESTCDNLKTWVITWNGPAGIVAKSETSNGPTGYRYATNTLPDNSQTITVYQNGQIQSVKQIDGNGVQLSSVDYGYDAHGRLQTETDTRNGTTTHGYNDADELTSTTSPVPGGGQLAQTTLTAYDKSLRATNVVAGGTSLTNEYYLTGELKRAYGGRNFPVGYGYNPQGRMIKMTNWSGFVTGSGPRVTTWSYDTYRGFLLNKQDANSFGPSYTYKPSGKRATRTWGRGITTTYNYNSGGDLWTVTYSDGSTPALTNTYDRRGRLSIASRNGIAASEGYNAANELLSESYAGGTLSGLSVTNGYDNLLRKTNVIVTGYGGTMNGYQYDAASRLSVVTDGANSATNTYLANSPLLSQILFKQNAILRMTTSKQYDYLNRLQQINSTPSGGQLPASFGYQYNNANQRTKTTLADNSQWNYGYDTLGQVTSGKKNWSDQIMVPSEQFEYVFDDIGNRTSTKVGGDAAGGNLRSASYSPNPLNQYSSRTVPGSFDVIGIVNGAATVTVNGQAPYRRNEFYDSLVTVNNSTASVYQAVTVNSVHGANNASQSGNVYVPPATENFGYDLDGNLTTDGRWLYTWDAENRLIQIVANPNITVPAAAKLKLAFEYDWQGRRIRKQVYTWNTGSSSYNASASLDLKFLYDGWNLLAELDGANTLQRAYLWGTDLSGSMQGAGGIGGLIAVKSTSTGTHFVAYDGNGNVCALIDASNGIHSAQYEYGPFGELIRATGPMAKANPFRFSTKFNDDETGLIYYGYRYYTPSQGIWPSRDPAGESGGRNLYAFCGNDSVNAFDVLGLTWKVERKGNDRASAKPQTGDTVSDLAKLIHFDDKDFKKWLKPVGPSSLPHSATDRLAGCLQFTVPNTVFIDIGPRIGGDNALYVQWADKINLTFTFLRSLAEKTGNVAARNGFRVIRTEPATGAQMRSHLSSPNISLYAFAGHGSAGAVNSTEDDALFPDRYTNYGISFMALLSCGSALNSTGAINSYPSNVSTRGTFYGSKNNYTALLAIILGTSDFVWVSLPGTN